jgi:hypothetical protein
MPANEFGKLVSFLARGKVTLPQVRAAIGTAANGRTRAGIAQAIVTWLRTAPKANG